MNYSVIIATSQKRTEWLINRSLVSVYLQNYIDKTDWNVFIIDDNDDVSEFEEINKKIEGLRATLKLRSSDFPTIVIRNSRTRYMSGTGAWNTGISEVFRLNPTGHVSILDDDDEYLPNHLSDCLKVINNDTVAVFQRLIWSNEDSSTMNVDLAIEKLTPENFFIGNPGVQGSNMFFKTRSLVEIGGFDETLPNTTDRDLMIRFLWKFDLEKIEVIKKIGVIHYNHKQPKVNNDIIRKHQGLDLFYKKYKVHFSEEAYQKSVTRAKAFFKYIPNEQIIICMPLKNAEKTLKNAIYSVLQQTNTKRDIILIIGNDNSTDNSELLLKEISSQNHNIVLLNVNFGSAYMNRNYLNEYARRNYPNCVLIGRLDADDIIFSDNTISQIESLFDKHNFDVLMCGNKQVKNGTVLEWENKPSKKLLQNDFLLNQLFEMTQSNPKAELPSCNTFIKPTLKVEYPNKASAEDHWFFVYLLMQKDNLNILIDDELLYCFYSLDGMATHSNKKSKDFFCSRKELYFFLKKEIYIDIIKRKWKDQITTEGLSFHQSNIKINKHKLEKYWSLTYPVNRRIENEISKLNIKQIKLLDVGCGPFPKSGIYHKDYEIQRVLVDTLATNFHSLLNENDICTNGQNIIIGNAEEIQSEIFECLFDIIYAKNTLDHSYNPIKAISNLSELLSGHGVIILEHYIKEGEYTEYFGLHQWNFYIENNNFMISSRDNIIVQNINNLYPLLEVNSFYDENKIINLIYKRKC